MAAGIFPGREQLACPGECEHTDCAEGRRVWATRTCGLCGRDVEPGQRHYGWPIYTSDRPGDLCHAACVEAT